MTDAQKDSIRQMRRRGLPYAAIATALGLSLNTVKSFCRRADIRVAGVPQKNSSNTCEQCKAPLVHLPGRKKKRFCCDKCRYDWWNANRSWARVSHRAGLP